MTLSVSALGKFNIGVLGARLLGARARARALARKGEAKGAARTCLPNLAGVDVPDGPQEFRTDLLNDSDTLPKLAAIRAFFLKVSNSC